MSPRPKTIRTVFDPPKFRTFEPTGYNNGDSIPIELLVEEYTALRLCDYELMIQMEAAAVMNISRPTFTRLYESARRKIARALSEARPISILNEEANYLHPWFHCRSCGCFFTDPKNMMRHPGCPLCSSEETEAVHPKTVPE